MRRFLSLFSSAIFVVFCLCAFAIMPVQARIPPKAFSQDFDFSALLKKAMPSVVNLSVRGQLQGMPPSSTDEDAEQNPLQHPYSFMRNPKFQHLGSGVIVDAEQGYILTNAHVIHQAETITVSLSDGRHFMGKKIGSDTASDIAVIQIKAKHLQALKLGNSDKVKVGDFVSAIGNPFGLNQTVTSGMVSALNRHIGLEGYENFIQTDASINPGNSGGALINMKGELIGINTAIISTAGGSLGIGFAVPSNMAKSVMQQLIRYGKLQRGLLGVMVQDLTPALAEALNLDKDQKGALITEIEKASAAERAGLQNKDVIIAINGVPVKNSAQVRSMIGVMRVGAKLSIKILRDGNQHTFPASIDDPEKRKKRLMKMQSPIAGMHMRTYDQMDIESRPVKGVQVLEISDRSLGWFTGIRPGDVVLSINGVATPNVRTLLEQITKDSQRLLFKIRRMNATIFLVMGA